MKITTLEQAMEFLENELDMIVTIEDNRILLDGDTVLTFSEAIREAESHRLSIKTQDKWDI